MQLFRKLTRDVRSYVQKVLIDEGLAVICIDEYHIFNYIYLFLCLASVSIMGKMSICNLQ